MKHDDKQMPPNRKSTKLRLRFTVKVLLIGIAVVAALFSTVNWRAHKLRARVAAMEQQGVLFAMHRIGPTWLDRVPGSELYFVRPRHAELWLATVSPATTADLLAGKSPQRLFEINGQQLEFDEAKDLLVKTREELTELGVSDAVLIYTRIDSHRGISRLALESGWNAIGTPDLNEQERRLLFEVHNFRKSRTQRP